MNLYKKISYIFYLCLLVNRLSAQTGASAGCRDSSYHIRHYSVNKPFQVFQQIPARNGGRIMIGQMKNTDSTAIMVAKVNKAQNIEWSKMISLPAGYSQLLLREVAEAANENIAISGTIGDNITTRQFYYAILSASGNLLKQDMPEFAGANGSYKWAHTICQRSADSLLFLYSSNQHVNGSKQRIYVLTCDNTGNAGSALELAMPLSERDITFSAATVSGNTLNLYGSGMSVPSCNFAAVSGTLTSVQYDLANQQVIYHKTYCIPYTYPCGYCTNPHNPESIFYSFQKIFFLRNGNIAMVRPYQGIPGFTSSFTPLFISYFDRSFTLLRNEYIQSNRFFRSPTIQDLLIDSNGIKHISFSDYNNKAVYFAVVDTSNNILLQKKMPIADFRHNNYDSRLQIIEPGMFTGFTTQNIISNASDLHYVQLQNKETADACFGSDTSFLSFIPVPLSPNISTTPILSYAASVVHLPINCQVTDLPMMRDDICLFNSVCDTLAIHAQDTVCAVNNPVTITVYKNPLCKGRILFDFDTAAVAGYTQPNDTTLLLTYSRSWQGKVIARLASCSLLQDSTDLIVSAPVSSFTLGDDVNYCPGKTYKLEAPAGLIKYEWQDGSTDSLFTATTDGVYYVKATDFCNRMYSDTIVIKSAGFSLSAGADTTICESESIILNATPGFSNYVWSPTYHISNTEGMQVTVFPDVTTSYTIQAEKFPGCIVTDTVTVSTKFCPQKFFIANAFSPNGDGKNELFKPYITGVLVHYEFTIYNRWGQQIFKTANRNEGWNGTIKGSYQNNNVFTWFCKYQFINQTPQVRKGVVTLIR